MTAARNEITRRSATEIVSGMPKPTAKAFARTANTTAVTRVKTPAARTF